MFEALLISLASQGGVDLVRPRPAPVAVSRPDQIVAGTTLARAIYSDKLNRAVVDYTIKSVIGPGYRADPALSALDTEHPGLIDAMLAAIKPELERGRTEALQSLWRDMGVAYASRLDARELAQAIAFHSGPVGQRLADVQTRAIAATEPGNAGSFQNGPAPKQSSADIAATDAFSRSVVGRKLAAMQAEITSINEAWNKRPDPATDARIQAALDRIMQRYQ